MEKYNEVEVSAHSPPQDSPTVEAYSEACLRDLMDPDQRREKNRENLTAEEREALKDFQNNFPQNNLRIRVTDLFLLMG